MDGIAAEIAEKISVLFQHYNIHAHTGQEKDQHHTGRTAPSNTAARAQRFAHESNNKSRRKYRITGNENGKSGRGFIETGGYRRNRKGRDIGYALAASSCEE